MDVAVIGAGSLGSLVGGLLAQRHRVTLIGREGHMRAVAADGLRICGLVDRTVHPATTTSWSGVNDPDVAILTVKSYDTRQAVAEIVDRPPPILLSLQNGLGNAETIRAALGRSPDILAGTTTYGALLEEAGTVRCTGLGSIVFGSPHGTRSASAEQLAEAWSPPLECRAAADMPKRLWEKVGINAAINPVSGLCDVRNGRVVEPPLRSIAFAAGREVARVAETRGFDIDPDDMQARIESVAQQTRGNISSMARDMRRNSRTEIESISGAVIERADSHEVPVNRVLYGLVVGYEKGRGIRSNEGR